MSEIVIEKNIKKPHRTCLSEYPFEKLEVGDSFSISLNNLTQEEVTHIRNRLSSAVGRAAATLNRRFSMRTLRAENCVRVWRDEGTPTGRKKKAEADADESAEG